MRYYLIAGEASGDMHASNLIKAIKRTDSQAEFRCFGGDLMKEAGAYVHLHYREMAMMGLVEVIRKYTVIRKHRSACRKDILEYKPDLLILVDYSGFNLPMARFAAANHIRVVYYISPKLWAWAQWRVKTIKRFIEKMFVILPFEVGFYEQHQVEAEYYGNPVLDSITEFVNNYNDSGRFKSDNKLNEKPIVALLAGSRKQEIDDLLPEMLEAITHYPAYQFVIAGAPSIAPEFYEKHISGKAVSVVYNQTYALLRNSEAAIVTSGTATLETALLNVPEVVIYKTNPVTFFIGGFVVKVKYFSLVNLILDKTAVKELLQDNLSNDIRKELDNILFDPEYRRIMLNNFITLRSVLGNPGVADRVAARIYQIARS